MARAGICGGARREGRHAAVADEEDEDEAGAGAGPGVGATGHRSRVGDKSAAAAESGAGASSGAGCGGAGLRIVAGTGAESCTKQGLDRNSLEQVVACLNSVVEA